MKRKITIKKFEKDVEEMKKEIPAPQMSKAAKAHTAERILALGRSGTGKSYNIIKYVANAVK